MYQPGGQGADRLRRLLAAPSILPLPTAHDALSAWSCEMAGFEALLLSRASVGLSALATEDAAAVDDSLLVAQAARVCQVVSLPVVVDLTPVPPGLSRLRRCAVALAVSGIAGLVVDDGGEAAPPAAGGPDGAEVLRQRLAAVHDGLASRALDLVVGVRSGAVLRGRATTARVLAELAALRPQPDLAVVDGLGAGVLLGAARPGGPALVYPDPGPVGDETRARGAEQAGFGALVWTTPLVATALAAMQHRLTTRAGPRPRPEVGAAPPIAGPGPDGR
jgi:methylisocitrate lyase